MQYRAIQILHASPASWPSPNSLNIRAESARISSRMPPISSRMLCIFGEDAFVLVGDEVKVDVGHDRQIVR
jgi:hypothetical protein